jgi:hypothetical protein
MGTLDPRSDPWRDEDSATRPHPSEEERWFAERERRREVTQIHVGYLEDLRAAAERKVALEGEVHALRRRTLAAEREARRLRVELRQALGVA